MRQWLFALILGQPKDPIMSIRIRGSDLYTRLLARDPAALTCVRGCSVDAAMQGAARIQGRDLFKDSAVQHCFSACRKCQCSSSERLALIL